MTLYEETFYTENSQFSFNVSLFLSEISETPHCTCTFVKFLMDGYVVV